MAKRHPARAALIDAARQLSFRQLDVLSNVYCRFLRNYASVLGNHSIVPIVADRNVETVVWMIACVKARVPFLNIDGGAPVAHIQKLLAQLHTRLCIVTADHVDPASVEDGLTTIFDCREVRMLMAGGKRKRLAETGVPPLRDLEVPMYAVSTSGTAGEPEIVLVPHRAFTNYSSFVQQEYGLNEHSGMAVCLLAPNSDVFLKETLVPLQAGMTVQLLSNEQTHDPTKLAAILNGSSSYWLHTTYTLFETIQSQLAANCIGHLIFVGEPPGPVSRRAFVVADNVWSEYGSAETPIGITSSRVRRGETTSIGRAIDNNFNERAVDL